MKLLPKPHYATIGAKRLGLLAGVVAGLIDLNGHVGHGAEWNHRIVSAVLLGWIVGWGIKSFVGRDVMIYVPRNEETKTHVQISSRGATETVEEV